MDWLTEHKLPLGEGLKAGMAWLETQATWLLDTTLSTIGFWIDSVIDLMQGVPPLPLVVLFTVLSLWLRRSWKLSAFAALALLLIINLGYWPETVETLVLVALAALIAMLIGVPLGIAASHRPWLHAALRPVIDLMQTVPTVVYLIPTLILFGLGVVPGLIATVFFALPAAIRQTHLGLASVPEPLLEAGKAFGATRRQLFWKVKLRHALPTMASGLNQCIMLSLSMVMIAALVGVGGLGEPFIRALSSVDIVQGFEAGLAIALLAILLDRLCRRDPEPGGL